MRNHITAKALAKAGGPVALAKALKVKQPSVSGWNKIPATRCLAVEKLTGVSRYKLRPDVYGREP